ncbi:MAG: hypothetical protein FJX53_13015, partial [Alphaproteobacteria bacterium]|nr:hypothetical protein [Alphaproteobacteria bacterium]
RPHAALKAFAAARGVPYLDLYALLAAGPADPAPLYWSNDDTHFNAAGHRRWAEALFAFITDPGNGLLPASAR